MPPNNLSKAATLALLLIVIVIGGWEMRLRSKGLTPSYDNGKELWSHSRAMVYEPANKTTVFIGSSRIKYDLDIDTWQQLTGRHAVQLAIEGSSPMPILTDLGNDSNFHGKLVIDVTEILFFAPAPPNIAKPQGYVDWYHKQTPAQKASFVLDHALESQFVFLDNEFLSLNVGLNKLAPPDRPGVFVFPEFPLDFDRTTFERQTKMTPRFLKDTGLQHRVQNIWVFLMEMGKHAPPPKGDPVVPVLAAVKTAVDKIRSRGGEVFFTRTPSSGPMWMGEQHVFPRAKAWEPLLTGTKSSGIYFTDDSVTSHLICPEWSHLSPQDAVVYTKVLIRQLPKSFVE